jgi:uncharacterized membrane protein YphA (DoxX/SURF4 family)
MKLLRLLARPMLAATFVAEGADAVIRPEAHTEKFKKLVPALEKAGVPPALYANPKMLARVSGAVATVSGLMLATGRRPRSAALTLALVNVPLTLVNNPVWDAHGAEERKRYLSGLLRGVSLGGGLLVAAADLGGKPSWGWRIANAREHRADVGRVRARLTNGGPVKVRVKGRYAD